MEPNHKLPPSERLVWLAAFGVFAMIMAGALYFFIFRDGVPIAASERFKARARVTQPTSAGPETVSPKAPTAAREKSEREERCAWIEAEIARIDAGARHDQSAPTQKEARRKVVDEKYRLKC